MKRTLVVESIQSSDRNIVLLFEDNQLTGLNFWQGSEDMALLPYFIESDYQLYNYLYKNFMYSDWWDNYEEFNFLHNSPDYWDVLNWIDSKIWDYLNIYMQIDELELQIKNLKKLL